MCVLVKGTTWSLLICDAAVHRCMSTSHQRHIISCSVQIIWIGSDCRQIKAFEAFNFNLLTWTSASDCKLGLQLTLFAQDEKSELLIWGKSLKTWFEMDFKPAIYRIKVHLCSEFLRCRCDGKKTKTKPGSWIKEQRFYTVFWSKPTSIYGAAKLLILIFNRLFILDRIFLEKLFSWGGKPYSSWIIYYT